MRPPLMSTDIWLTPLSEKSCLFVYDLLLGCVKRKRRTSLVPVGCALVGVRHPEYGRLGETPADESEPDRQPFHEPARDAGDREPGQAPRRVEGDQREPVRDALAAKLDVVLADPRGDDRHDRSRKHVNPVQNLVD